jgi:hypothetical protein
MARNAVIAIAILLCVIVLATVIVRERCRLGNDRWQACIWMNIPHAGGPFPAPPS